jgi:hypothetical protein
MKYSARTMQRQGRTHPKKIDTQGKFRKGNVRDGFSQKAHQIN